MIEYILDNRTWEELKEKIANLVKPFDQDPNTLDYAIFIHNIPSDETKKDEKGNLYSKIKTITDSYDGVELEEPHTNHTRSMVGKEVMTIEIRRIKK